MYSKIHSFLALAIALAAVQASPVQSQDITPYTSFDHALQKRDVREVVCGLYAGSV